MRSPCIVAGPGVPAGGVRDGLCYLFDLTQTVAAAAGLGPLPGGDGVDLWPMLRGEGGSGRDKLLLLYADTQRAIVYPKQKLIRLPRIDRSLVFDLEQDPHELRDLSADPAHGELVRALGSRLRTLQQRTGDELPWTAEEQLPVEVDLTGKRWRADRWQPLWIRRKYWPRK